MAQAVHLRQTVSLRWFATSTIAAGSTLVAAFAAAATVSSYARHHALGEDSYAYWLAGHTDKLYGLAPGARGAYLYSPAFSQVLHPLTWLPLTVFQILWSLAEAAMFAWLLKPLGLRWGVPAFLVCLPEIVLGNVYGLFALVLVVGFRWPAAWALPALTKITPAVGFVWFAVRREWRNLAIAAAATLALVLVSVAISASDWSAWISFLHSQHRSVWVFGRLILGTVVAAIAAWKNVRWLLAVAMLLAIPMMFHETVISLLAALPRLVQMGMPQPRQVAAGTLPHTST